MDILALRQRLFNLVENKTNQFRKAEKEGGENIFRDIFHFEKFFYLSSHGHSGYIRLLSFQTLFFWLALLGGNEKRVNNAKKGKRNGLGIRGPKNI